MEKLSCMVMIAIIILLSGCRTKPSGVSRCIHFDFTQEMKDVHTMGLLKDCTIVPLETNDSVLIGEIDKVIFYETRLYVATFSPEQAVYIFNLQGKFKNRRKAIGVWCGRIPLGKDYPSSESIC